MLNRFQNDRAYVSTNFLLRLIRGQGLQVQHLLRISHRGTGATHILALLPRCGYICDCCMGTNLGIPCRHYFQALSVAKGRHFSIELLRPR